MVCLRDLQSAVGLPENLARIPVEVSRVILCWNTKNRNFGFLLIDALLVSWTMECI